MKMVHMLIVEDNPADADLTAETLEASHLRLDYSVVMDGEAAMDFLHQRGRYADAKRPDLILLDLNIPRKDGRTVLREIKEDDRLKSIPVVVLTSSQAERDIVQSYSLGANCYVTKPVDLKAFQEIVRGLEGFWFALVKLPENPGATR